jgi:hypothetical protein
MRLKVTSTLMPSCFLLLPDASPNRMDHSRFPQPSRQAHRNAQPDFANQPRIHGFSHDAHASFLHAPIAPGRPGIFTL